MSAFGGKADIASNSPDVLLTQNGHAGSPLGLPDPAIPEGQLANFSSAGGRIWPDIVFLHPAPRPWPKNLVDLDQRGDHQHPIHYLTYYSHEADRRERGPLAIRRRPFLLPNASLFAQLSEK